MLLELLTRIMRCTRRFLALPTFAALIERLGVIAIKSKLGIDSRPHAPRRRETLAVTDEIPSFPLAKGSGFHDLLIRAGTVFVARANTSK